jgi:hypothetical protein
VPDESDLKRLLAGTEAPNTLDVSRIVRRSRARRLPKQLAAGGIGALAVVGITVLGVQTFTPAGTPITSMEAAPTQDQAAGSGIKRAPAERINLCEGPLAEVAPSVYGLRVDATFPESIPAGTAPVPGVVRLTNTSGSRVTGTTAPSPAITLSQDGIVLWHSNGPVDASAVVVDLEPGESLEYAASFVPVRCAVEDDAAESFRADLPAVEPGVYELSAAIDFSPTPSADVDLVTGPRSTVTIGARP